MSYNDNWNTDANPELVLITTTGGDAQTSANPVVTERGLAGTQLLLEARCLAHLLASSLQGWLLLRKPRLSNSSKVPCEWYETELESMSETTGFPSCT